MDYKESLITQIESAKEWMVSHTIDSREEMELAKYTLITTIDYRIFDNCDSELFKDLEYISADPLVARDIIYGIKNNLLFKKLGFRANKPELYDADVINFQREIERVRLASNEELPIINIPMKPRDMLYKVIESMRELRYSESHIRDVVNIILPDAKYPKLSNSCRASGKDREDVLNKYSDDWDRWFKEADDHYSKLRSEN